MAKRGPKDRFDWPAIQAAYDAGLSPRQLTKKFRFASTTLMKAERIGKFKPDPNRMWARRGHNQNLVGQKFGRLTVIEKSSEKSCRNETIWLCKCLCGNNVFATTARLNSGTRQSCGCIKHAFGNKSHLWKGHGEIGAGYWGEVKNKRFRNGRELDFTITIEQAWDLFLKQNRRCALSGLPLKFNIDGAGRTASLDRIDSSGGYVLENCQWVHKDINYLKSDIPENRFFNFIKLIYEFRNLK